jgi:predicted phage tail protein
MVGTVTEYAIDLSTDGGAWKTVVNGKFDGKTTTEYQRDHRIDLPKSTSGWSVRSGVLRLMPADQIRNWLTPSRCFRMRKSSTASFVIL